MAACPALSPHSAPPRTGSTRRHKRPLEGIVHNETYLSYSNERIDEIYREKEVAGGRYMQDKELSKKIIGLGAKFYE